jgi:electron transport complex protein RnfD
MGNARLPWMAAQLFSGGLMLGAIFMATDYVTSPITHLGQIIYGIGCGILTVVIRYFGGYNEGVSYAILVMNCCVVLLDRIGRPTKFGAPAKQKKGAAK